MTQTKRQPVEDKCPEQISCRVAATHHAGDGLLMNLLSSAHDLLHLGLAGLNVGTLQAATHVSSVTHVHSSAFLPRLRHCAGPCCTGAAEGLASGTLSDMLAKPATVKLRECSIDSTEGSLRLVTWQR